MIDASSCTIFVNSVDRTGRRSVARRGGSARRPARSQALDFGGMAAVDRQVDAEAGPDADVALDLDLAAVLCDDAVADAQAQARAPPHGLGGEERIEDLRQHVGGN